MWQLHVTGGAGEWTVEGEYADLTSVTRRVLELEGDQTPGICYNLHVLGNVAATDTEILSEFEYEGRRALYAVRRRVQ